MKEKRFNTSAGNLALTIMFLILLFPSKTFAQNEQETIFTSTRNMKARELYIQSSDYLLKEKYTEALFLVNKAVSIDSNYIDARMRIASILHRQGDSIGEAEQYLKVMAINPQYSIPYFNYAMIQFKNCNYADAKAYFLKFLEYDATSKKYQGNARDYIEICDYRMKMIAHPVPFNPVNAGSGINTIRDEYWPALTADDKLMFFTRRQITDTTKPDNYSNSNEDIFTSNFKGQEWAEALSLPGTLNTKDNNEGAIALSPDGTFLLFTICTDKPNFGYGWCDIYYSELKNGIWQAPKNIGPPINTNMKETQPSISFDGKTLYFSSNRPGTLGKLDIWKSTKGENGLWSTPVNLGDKINTPGNDQSPYIHPDDHTLYFSNDYKMGMGGSDIFMAKKDNLGNWGEAQNLGYPINTEWEEMAIFVNARGDKAYFASKRDEGFGGLDIYYFTMPKKFQPEPVFYLKGTVFDSETKAKLSAEFELVDLETGLVVKKSVSEPGTGKFLVTIPSNTDYALNVSKDGYLFYSANLPIKGITSSSFEKDVPLVPVKIGQKLILHNIFFDFDKWDLLPKSKVELAKVIDFMNKYPTVKVELSGHTDNYGTEEYNITLSNNRAKSVTDYLVNIGGIDPSRIIYKGFGEGQPIDTNDTDAGRANNRRTEIKIIGM